jgi:hypothetical protein
LLAWCTCFILPEEGEERHRHEQDIELIKSRLRDAELHYRARIENGEGK